jgi:hypothetical protein
LGGYAFAYQDTVSSAVCLEGCPPSSPGALAPSCGTGTALCGHGDLGMDLATNGFAAYGGGIGFNLNQPLGTATAQTFAAMGSGIAYTVTSVPLTGLRINIDHGGVTYCATATTASATLPWASFNTQCYNTPADGIALTGAPLDATQIEFAMVAVAASVSDDFCVTAVSFAP